MKPTPFSDLNGVLVELAEGMNSVLGQDLIGLYLQGSFAVGDFDEHSDVDFIAVVKQELSNVQLRMLNTLHERTFNIECEWAKHIEGSYFSLDSLAAEPGSPVWYLDHGHQKLERSNHCNTMVVRWILEHHGIALAGPPAVSIVPHVPAESLKREIRATLLDWGGDILADPKMYDNRFYQGFIVLSYCRMLHDLKTGCVGSKRGGAEWAKQNLPPQWHGLIDRTWACRPNPSLASRTPADQADFASTLEFVRFAMDAVNG